MSKPTRRRRETGGIRKRGRVYWIHYRVDGQRYWESTGQGDEREARRILAQRRREIRDGTWMPPKEPRRVLTVAAYAEQWLERREAAGVKNVHDEEVWIRRWLLEPLGQRPLAEVTRADIREIIATMRQTASAAGRPYSPRTVLHVYATIRLLFADAVADELVAATPCTLRVRAGELPAKRDADPRWRARAIYTRKEAELLISDARIPADRRVYYALQLLAGLRSGEASARRWSDLDAAAEPLGRMLVWNQAVKGEERATKTGDVREVPIHPTLAAVLAEWRLHGFPMLFGRRPLPDDFIVPSRRGVDVARTKKMLVRLKEDLGRLGLRSEGRGRHAMRATFLTLLETDGAHMGIAARATHRTPLAPAGAVGGYLRPSWEALCTEIGKLRVELVGGQVIPLRQVASAGSSGDSSGDSPAETTPFSRRKQSGRLDSKRRAARERRGNGGSGGAAVARWLRRSVAKCGGR